MVYNTHLKINNVEPIITPQYDSIGKDNTLSKPFFFWTDCLYIFQSGCYNFRNGVC